jgi:hypothetical protein
MATFPVLKTDAVAQYPARRVVRFQNEVLRFVDGTEQRYRDCAGPLHRWEIRLDQLDEAESAALNGFFAACQGSFESFEFTDPWNGQVYGDCSLKTDGMEVTVVAEMKGRTVLTVVENRG